MSNPWDVPPIPNRGDEDEDATYAGVGRVMSRWEAVEVELAHLYTIFVNRPHEADAIKAYGMGRIFAERLALLREAAERYFVSSPDQAIEGAARELLDRVRRYSDRRNEVAHGIVRQMRWVRGVRDNLAQDAVGRFQHCLVPPHYTFRKFDQHNRPTYAYASAELLTLDEKLFWLAHEVQDLRLRLDPEA
jgi:hypothetical protein